VVEIKVIDETIRSKSKRHAKTCYFNRWSFLGYIQYYQCLSVEEIPR
jgi:hypothetical protein